VSVTWQSDELPGHSPLGPISLLRAGARAVPLALLVFGCLALLLAVRMLERPIFGVRRPITPYITQFVCRNAFRLMGMGFSTTGQLMQEPGAVVANHSSWLDIFALNARKRIYFVSKAEVRGWPGIGWLARATGTVFIQRDRSQARAHTELFRDRLMAGHKLLFFPEGTSTDGRRILPFKTTLFAAFFDPALRDMTNIQPVSVIYHAPPGKDPRFYGWWGDMSFGSHLIHTLAAAPQGRVELIYHDPIKVSQAGDRKSLAAACEHAVRAGVMSHLDPGAPEG